MQALDAAGRARAGRPGTRPGCRGLAALRSTPVGRRRWTRPTRPPVRCSLVLALVEQLAGREGRLRGRWRRHRRTPRLGAAPQPRPADTLEARGRAEFPSARRVHDSSPREPLLAAPATTKHIFVTGGVASSIGKGLTASGLGHLLRSRGLRVTMQKLDPYLNVDPGTMNPFQHGEVFVTDDGAETDLDVGHYERFLDARPARLGERHHRTGLLGGDRQGAARRVPRRHGPGDPAHHQRDQGPDPRDGRSRASTSSSPRSAAPSATSSRCRSSRRSARSGTTSAGTTSSSCTSRWCPTSGRPAS